MIAGRAPAEALVPAPCRIRSVTPETADTFTLALEVGGGYRFAPGQFNMLYVFGVGEVAISVSGDPAAPAPLVHTVRAVGSVTRAMQRLGPGDALGVRGPYGRGWPLDAARGRDLVLVAGGLGLPPLRPVVYHVLRHRQDFRRVALLYGARTPDDMVYRDELESWRWHGLPVHLTVDRADRKWPEHIGLVTKLLPRAVLDPPATVAMLCGPEIMMRVTARALERAGVPPGQIHLSLERNMKCGVGLCGHCQYQPLFVCKDGPVHAFDRLADLLERAEL